MDWRYSSEDIDSISLHDCNITAWEFGEDIVLSFEDGFDVAEPNPLNDTGRHKRTGSAAAVLKTGKLLKAEYPSYEDSDGSIVPAKEIAQSELPLLEIEVYGFESYENGILTPDCFAGKNRMAFCRVKMSCNKLLFCWNEFTDDAWFQE